jgi:hypothetical protein
MNGNEKSSKYLHLPFSFNLVILSASLGSSLEKVFLFILRSIICFSAFTLSSSSQSTPKNDSKYKPSIFSPSSYSAITPSLPGPTVLKRLTTHQSRSPSSPHHSSIPPYPYPIPIRSSPSSSLPHPVFTMLHYHHIQLPHLFSDSLTTAKRAFDTRLKPQHPG